MEDQEREYIPLTEENFKEYIPYDGLEISEDLKRQISLNDAYIYIKSKNNQIVITDKLAKKSFVRFIKINGDPIPIFLNYLKLIFIEKKSPIYNLSYNLIKSIEDEYLLFQPIDYISAEIFFENIKPILNFLIEKVAINSANEEMLSDIYNYLISSLNVIKAKKGASLKVIEICKNVKSMIFDYLAENIKTEDLILFNDDFYCLSNMKLILLERKYKEEKEKGKIKDYFEKNNKVFDYLIHYDASNEIFNGDLKSVFVSIIGENYTIKKCLDINKLCVVNLFVNAKLLGINIKQDKYIIDKQKMKITSLFDIFLLSMSGSIDTETIFIQDKDAHFSNYDYLTFYILGKYSFYNNKLLAHIKAIPYEEILGKDDALFYGFLSFIEMKIFSLEDMKMFQEYHKKEYKKYEECKLKIQLHNF